MVCSRSELLLSWREAFSGNAQGILGEFDFLSDDKGAIVIATGESLTIHSKPMQNYFTGEFTFLGFPGRPIFQGTNGAETIIGSVDNDALRGDGGNDILRAGAGDDVVYGGLGDDVLYGGEDDDVINGGYGNDWLIGGSGADKFFINAGVNIIENFDTKEGDSILLGKYLTNVELVQDGDNAIVTSDQGVTTILNNVVHDIF